MSLVQQGIDIVIVSRRGASAVQKVIMDTQKNPLFWLKSKFTIVFDEMSEEVEKLRSWYNSIAGVTPLPRLKIINIDGKRGNMNYLRQQGIDEGNLPFIYFQDDDDDLPTNAEIFLKILDENQELHAVFGVTESIDIRYQLVERFPSVNSDGHFKIDPVEGTRWFPTYPHPCAGIFRRKTFESFPLYSGTLYKVCGNGAYLIELLNSGGHIVFIPYVIRRALLHENNMTPPVISTSIRHALAEDIQNWQKYITNHEVKMFQNKIIERLECGDITSFKEIGGMVEERYDRIVKGISPSSQTSNF